MFTGIVEEMGTVRTIDAGRLVIGCRGILDDVATGDSVSVNGACLTATEVTADGFAAALMGETLARTALGDLEAGAPVNLERALRADTRLGGHLVQGHVDAVAPVLAVEPRSRWTVMTVGLPDALSPYVVEKGSITVEGASLTVMSVAADAFTIGLIPHTLAVTVLGRRGVGDRVNLEVDVIAKYVERLLRGGVGSPYADPGTARSADGPPSTSPDEGS